MDVRSLDGFRIGGYTLRLKLWRQGRFVEEFNFAFDLLLDGRILCPWFLWGKVFYGRKPYYRPWLEIAYREECRNRVDVGEFLRPFLEMVPPGGHVMVEYDFDTYRELNRKPPEEVWLGRLLLESGFGSLRNWYIPEGWKEGGMKLQGFKR